VGIVKAKHTVYSWSYMHVHLIFR